MAGEPRRRHSSLNKRLMTTHVTHHTFHTSLTKVRLRGAVHAVTSVTRPRHAVTLPTLVISGLVTVVVESARAPDMETINMLHDLCSSCSPVLPMLLIPVAPEPALCMVLAQRLAVAHSLQMCHLNDQVLLMEGIAEQTIHHITLGQSGGSGCCCCSSSTSSSCRSHGSGRSLR